MLTTITPYWGRPQMLARWLKCLRAAAHPKVSHMVIFAGEAMPQGLEQENVRFIRTEVPRVEARPSIGHFHNLGAQLANTEWMMKLDVDALPNANYFRELIPVLENAKPREWFNGGMFYVNKLTSLDMLDLSRDLLSEELYKAIVRRIPTTAGISQYDLPAATNFICRTQDYLRLGGCDERFRGWGWEDYQQIYMLERYQQGQDPLPGDIDLNSICGRCREEISRPKAAQLYKRNEFLALLHHWHPVVKDPRYKGHELASKNRQVLLNYILQKRNLTNCSL